MKSLFFIIFGLLLVNSNNLIKCDLCSENFQKKCVLCEERPCQCEELISEDNSYKISFKKLIIAFLKKINYKCHGDTQPIQECRCCRNSCSKKHGIAKVLADILKKACTCEKEEETIKEIILSFLDPSECERKPCQAHCDPQVQEILRAILRKAAGCNCDDCPSNCLANPPHCGQEEYKYWFKTRKEAMRKEISDRSEARLVCPQKKTEERNTCPCVKISKIYNKNKEVYKCASDNCKKCKTCQKPNKLICPRYVTDDCPIRSEADSFSLCADCDNCRILPNDQKSCAVLFCMGCKAMNSPFVQFTPNGYPFRKDTERNAGIQIRTKFLQINDFRESEAKPVKTVLNPFQPNCNVPRKKKCTRRSAKKFKWT